MPASGTVCVWAARPAVATLRERGIDAAAVLVGAGLSPQALDDVEARLPVAAVNQLWELAAAAAADPFFGVHVAATVPAGSADLLEYLGSASATLGEAYERIAHYSRVFYDRSNLTLLVEPRQARLVRRETAATAQFAEFISAYLVESGRRGTAVHWKPTRVSFQHAPPPGRREPPALFGCPIAFTADELEICFARDLLDLPEVRSDSRLLEILLRYAETLLASRPAGDDLVARVSASIAHQLRSAVPTLASTAAVLHMNPRTLQRRLAQDGVTHNLLVDEVRRGLALKYIVDAGLSIDEIAYVLQFSGGTAFSRAFKRWTGESPLQYRNRALRSR